MALVVVKVGGSLYDLPDLGGRLSAFLATLTPDVPVLVPGGGPTTDAIRALDRDQKLGPTASHWLALRACEVNAHFLAHLLGAAVVADPREARGPSVLAPFAFAVADEGRPGCLPHTWDATSDAVAARVAEVAGARLVVLKSVAVAGGSWDEARRAGHVDAVFPQVVRRAGLNVAVVNLREWPGG